MNRKKILIAALSLLLVVGAALGLGGILFSQFIIQPLSQSTTITIEKGWGVARVAQELEKRHILSSASWFRLLVKLDGKGFIKAGEYQLAAGLTPPEILSQLKKGEVVQYRLSFPEGLTVQEMVDLMKKAGLPGSDTLLSQADLTKTLGVDAPNLEGWFFPDTYHYTKEETALTLASRMVSRTKKILDSEWAKREPDYSLTRYETLILASIIEKETGLARERPLISRVFHNRLQKKMKLQTDPTVIYGIPHFDGNITRKHLRTPTPYNTYTIPGLPPTPISNPGREAIHAALHPQKSEALYFVSRGDRSHAFSKTLREHEAYVDCYQRKRGCKKVP
ncbi:MAG: endolytic transglycosylase MltG [Magnetococcales bacterium]|nr:endolytic transglycosylase MltG [Magnetococcales bacterium]